MAEQVAPQGGQETTPPPTPPPAAPSAEDRDTPKFTQREFDHHITQRLAEERQRLTREHEVKLAEVAPKLTKLEGLEQAQAQAAQDSLTREQQLEAELNASRDALAQKDGELATTKAAVQQARSIRRQEQINLAIDATGAPLLPEQRERLQQRFADVEALDPNAVAEAAQAEQAAVVETLKAWGYVPQGVNVGSPGTPPAEPHTTGQAEYEAQLVDLVERAEAGDDAALVEYQQAKARRP